MGLLSNLAFAGIGFAAGVIFRWVQTVFCLGLSGDECQSVRNAPFAIPLLSPLLHLCRETHEVDYDKVEQVLRSEIRKMPDRLELVLDIIKTQLPKKGVEAGVPTGAADTSMAVQEQHQTLHLTTAVQQQQQQMQQRGPLAVRRTPAATSV